MLIKMSRVILFYLPPIAQSDFFHSTESVESLKAIGCRLIKRVDCADDVAVNVPPALPLSPLPVAIVTSFISFVVTCGVDPRVFIQVCGFSSLSDMASAPLSLSLSPSPWDSFHLRSVLLLGFIRSLILNADDHLIFSYFETVCDDHSLLSALIHLIKENSAQTWIRLCVCHLSLYPSKRNRIMTSLWHFCENAFAFLNDDRQSQSLWTESSLFEIRSFLCFLRLLLPSFSMESIVIIIRFINSKRNFSYTVHQWCSEVWK